MSIKKSFIASKSAGVGWTFLDKDKYQSFVASLPDHKYLLTIEMFYPIRSLPQNGYLHAIFGMISDVTGNDPDETKFWLKQRFAKKLKKDPFTGDEMEVVQRTSEMDTLEMTTFIENIRNWSWEFLNTYIPTPEEYIESKNKGYQF